MRKIKESRIKANKKKIAWKLGYAKHHLTCVWILCRAYIWIFTCSSVILFYRYSAFPTFLHFLLWTYSYWPVCVLLWILRFSDLANTFPQPGNGHGNGFSPVCTRMWFTSLYLALNGLPSLGHSSQKHIWFACSGPPTCSTVTCVTSSCMVL